MCETRLSRIEFRTPVASHAGMCRALLGDIPGVSVVDGKLLEGCVADAVIAPTNGFGYLDTGIEGAFARRFGRRLQRTLQERVDAEFDAELEVGRAAIMASGDLSLPFVVVTPCASFPGTVAAEPLICRALLAALRAVDAWNRADDGPAIESVIVPDVVRMSAGWEPDSVFASVRSALDAWRHGSRGNRRQQRAA
jgi:O-acetyl-ADP-ribose deacetylase (regulator of RNase III)